MHHEDLDRRGSKSVKYWEKEPHRNKKEQVRIFCWFLLSEGKKKDERRHKKVYKFMTCTSTYAYCGRWRYVLHDKMGCSDEKRDVDFRFKIFFLFKLEMNSIKSNKCSAVCGLCYSCPLWEKKIVPFWNWKWNKKVGKIYFK